MLVSLFDSGSARRSPADWHVGHACTVSDAPESTATLAPDDRGRRGAGGISAFIARILEQLSPNSWLPAMFLLGNVAVLFELDPSGWKLGLGGAVSRLMRMGWGTLVILLFAVVLATIAIQAFEFELLRVLEGYWRRPAGLVRWGERRIKRHRRLYLKIVGEISEVESGWITAKLQSAILNGEGEDVTLWGMALKIAKHSRVSTEETLLLGKLSELRRRSAMDAETDHRLVVLKLRLEDYPKPERILPTRLGNVMRSAEDQVHLEPGATLEGFMIRHLDSLPITIADEYRIYRERLDMYCAMVLVLLALSATAILALPFSLSGFWWHIAIPVAYLLAVWPCYNATLASARGFGGALVEADEVLRRRREPAPSPAHTPSTPAPAPRRPRAR